MPDQQPPGKKIQPLQAHPLPFEQLFDFLIHLFPHALPMRHVLQHRKMGNSAPPAYFI
ncbi:hypothetical protein [Roseovarius albus]|uniref:hypothetical protein n=1 Tax=Roseovarius albus TaxID=1247867 RepID=UPI0013565A28|nr:hypothetical protein [Roseovarius albus]